MLQCDLADKWKLYVFLARSASSGNFLISWLDMFQVATIILLARSASSGNYYFLGTICFKKQLLFSWRDLLQVATIIFLARSA
jgi:hypothetical protein